MSASWNGSIVLNAEQRLKVSLTPQEDALPPSFGKEPSLHFLSIVETAQIPLCIFAGPPIPVTTTDLETERWFSTILVGNDVDQEQQPWWQRKQADSSLGVLVGLTCRSLESDQGITELLFFATQTPPLAYNRPPTPPSSSPVEAFTSNSRLRVVAQPLCSTRLRHVDSSPPPSPGLEDVEVGAIFLPLVPAQITETGEVINLPPVRKRKTVDDTFNEAAERRKISRRKVGPEIAAAARRQPDHGMPTLNHRRSISTSQSVPLQSRPPSRASSIASSRFVDGKESSVPALTKRSSLVRVQAQSPGPRIDEEPSIEQKNKDLVSKLVMAGMRIFGIVQSQSRKSRRETRTASPALDAGFVKQDADRLQDEEYKLMYHQVYKGVCFAFRQHMAVKPLQPHTEALREMADRLLAIFYSDPFAMTPTGGIEEMTPGGRTAFGSSALRASEKNPFQVASHSGIGNESNTPFGRRPTERDRVRPA